MRAMNVPGCTRTTLRIVATVGPVVLLVFVMVGCGGVNQTTTTTLPGTTMAPGPTSLPETTATTQAVTTTGVPTTLPPPATSSTEAETTTTTEVSGPTTTEQLSSAETRLPDGTIKGMGYIDRVWESGGRRYLSIDYAEMLTGEEAIQAAVEAGVIAPGEDLPNDYFIRNVNPLKREFTVSMSVTIATSTRMGVMDQPATWAEFLSFWGPTPPEDATHLKNMPWWITRDGTEVIDIAEQYLP